MASIHEQEDTTHSMESLPEEMLIEILSHVPGRDLLNRCRLVCRSWNTLSTSICRRRHFNLNLFRSGLREAPLLKKVCSVFTNMDHLPWSSVYLPAYDKRTTRRMDWMHDGSFKKPQLVKFIRRYGHHIRKISIGGDDGTFPFELLPQMPNLEVLTVTVTFNFTGWKGVPTDSVKVTDVAQAKSLTKLRRLSSRVTDSSSVQLLTTLLRDLGVKLTWIELTYFSGLSTDDPISKVEADHVGTLIASVPFISLNFTSWRHSTSPFRALAQGPPGVKGLTFKLSLPGPINGGPLTIPYTGPLAHFLSHNSGTLRHLDISCSHNCGLEHPKLTNSIQIPPLGALKTLKLSDGRTQHPCPFDFLRPFDNCQFPALESVDIVTTSPASDQGLQLFSSCHFDTVTHLVIHDFAKHRTMNTEWGRVFPHLHKLETGVNGKHLMMILSQMTQLEHLKLALHTQSFEKSAITKKYATVSDGDVNSILSGFEDPDAFCKESQDQIRRYRNENPAPSLLSLKDLKTLSLDFRRPTTKLTDSGATLSLLQIPPLQFLGVYGSEISDECKSRLRKYHVNFDCK